MNNDPRNPDIPEQEQDSTIFSHHKSGCIFSGVGDA